MRGKLLAYVRQNRVWLGIYAVVAVLFVTSWFMSGTAMTPAEYAVARERAQQRTRIQPHGMSELADEQKLQHATVEEYVRMKTNIRKNGE